MFSYIYMLYIGLVSYYHIANVNAQVTLQSNNVMPTPGNSLTLSCLIQDVVNDQAITWYRPKSFTGNSPVCLRQFGYCIDVPPGYVGTANQSGAYLKITSINRDQDEGTWKCGYRGSDGMDTTKTLNITVYTLPSQLVYTKDVQAPSDLIVSNLSLQCKTSGCAYPPTVIKWFYKTQTSPAVSGVYPVGIGMTSSVDSCSSQEKIYTSKLQIPLYTTWSDNSDKIVTFYCGIEYPDPSRNIQSADSGTVRFAVRVTQVELQQKSVTIPDTIPLIVTAGEQVTLTCIPGTSRPAPTIDWYIEMIKMSSGTSPYFTFTPGNDDHNKTVYCQAYNSDPPQPVDSQKPRFYVRVAVTSVTLNISASEVVFYEGYPQMLTCVSSPSRPVSTVRWFLGSRLLTNNITTTNTTDATGLYILTSQLFLTLMRNASRQQIKCEGFIDGQQAVTSVEKPSVNVWYKPNEPLVREYGGANSGFPWLENMTGTLRCYSSDYGNPVANVTWLSDRGVMDSMNNLVIIGLMPSDDNRNISCKLVNRFTSDKNTEVLSNPVMLNVEYHPVIKYNTSSRLLMNETQSISVMCEAVGNPNPQFVQWKNQLNSSTLRLDNISRMIVDGSTLRLDNISRMENGTYICEATAKSTKYGTLTAQKQIDITVQYAPDVKVTLTGSNQQNQTAILVCEAEGFPAQYVFNAWVHKWEDMVIRTGLQGVIRVNQSILTIDRLSLENMGTYICTANNGITGINGNINQTGSESLNVTGVPVAFVRDTFWGETNMSASIMVHFFSNPVIIALEFLRAWNNTPVANDTDTQVYHTEANISNVFNKSDVVIKGNAAILHFSRLQQSDFGQYTLVLCNNRGNTTLSLHLNASAPPSPVEQFYLYKLIGQYMEFFFVPGFNGGHEQTFTIQFKPSGSLDEAWKNTSINGLSEMDKKYRLPNGTFLVQIEKIQPGRYVFRMFSVNKKNKTYSQEFIVYIEAEQNTDANIGLSIAGIAGGIGGGLVVILVIGVVIFFWRRHSHANKAADDDLHRELQERGRPESGLVDNPVYEKSSPRPGESTSMDATGTMYATVIKTKNTVPVAEDPRNLYAQVEKTTKMKSKRGEIYENAYLPKKSQNQENVYENSTRAVKETSVENLYEDSGATSMNVKQVNKIGLHYADLKLDLPTMKNGKYVIHGLENRTEYAEIAYGKRGDPLPDSNDEEERNGGAK